MTADLRTASVPNVEWERSPVVPDAVFVVAKTMIAAGMRSFAADMCTMCIFNSDRNDHDVNNCRIHQCRGGQWVSVLTAATLRLES